MFKDPTSDQLKIVYQNPETCAQLTSQAMQACLGLGIDYKELLPKHYENKIQSKSLNEEQKQV